MITLRSPGFRKFARFLARIGLGASFLSSVADRFGAWGAHGTSGVSWGNFQQFITYTETMMPWAPEVLVSVLAWLTTVLEAALGLGLLLGVRTRTMAFGSGCLLFTFALAMAFAPEAGIHAVFASSVVSAAGASMLLACEADDA